MWEHRLIERMLRSFQGEMNNIREHHRVDIIFIDTAVDFIRTYADRTHHGKEEDILFRDLRKKALTDNHARIMGELIDDHVYARGRVAALVEAKERYLDGEDTVREVAAILFDLAEFYPRHIEKEDKHFFYPCMEYFTKEEQDRMLEEFFTFDRNMIHEKYRKVVDQIEDRKRQP
jgi:hemerythrin-like domain-containing protein